jgi:hypothetical protein
VVEDLKEQHIDRDASVIQEADDTFAAGVERSRNDPDLMAAVQSVLIVGLSGMGAEVPLRAPPRLEACVDGGNVLGIEPLHP